MKVKKLLEAFVSSKEPGAIVLQGSWGVGKTYFWKHQIVPYLLNKPWKKKYSYVSLFGINSLPELKIALAVATEEFDADEKKRNRLASRSVGWFWRAQAWASDFLELTPKVGNALSKLYQRVGFQLIKERTICFDDIERHGQSLHLQDFLGMVSYLVEQRDCRVVVILNDGQLNSNDQGVWRANREKVFHGEVTYRQNEEETIDLGLAEDANAPWHGVVRSAFLELSISNIRLVQRVVRFMRLLWGTIGTRSLNVETIERIGRVVTLLVWAAHGEDAPALDVVLKRGEYDDLLPRDEIKVEKTAQQKEWDEILSGYGVYIQWDIDKALVNMVVSGVPEEISVLSGIDELERQIDYSERKDAWHRAWGNYHNTIEENQNEIIASFERAWPGVAAHEHPANLKSAVRMMRLLGRPDLATQFIGLWVDARKNGRSDELTEDQLHTFEAIHDQEILDACRAALLHERNQISLRQAFEVSLKSDHISDEVANVFSRAEVNQILNVFEQARGDGFMRTIKRLAGLSDYPDGTARKVAGDKVKEACVQIAGRSALNANRIENWTGIRLDGQ